MKKLLSTLTVLAILSACQQPTADKTIVASTSIVADWVENIAGPDWKVVSLVGRDGDAHTYEPSPADVQTLARASLIVINGAGLEHDWLHPILDSSQTKAPILKLAEHAQLIKSGEEHHDDDHDKDHDEDEEEHHHGEYDPHVWLSPRRVRDMVTALMQKLISLDPANEQSYRQRTASYVKQLDELDGEITRKLAGIPKDRRKLVLLHKAFAYFAEDYDFEQTSSILRSLTTQTRDPSAADVAKLVDLLKKEKIPAIFDENIAKNPVSVAIARDAGVKLAPALYTGALGQPGTPGATYLGMMRHNADTILEALR